MKSTSSHSCQLFMSMVTVMNQLYSPIRLIALLLCISLCTPTITSGQYASGAYEVEFGPEFQFKKTRFFHEIVHADSLNTYVSFSNRYFTKQVLREFDADMKPTGREVILDDRNDKSYVSLTILPYGDGLINFLVDQDHLDLRYFYQKVDLKNMALGPREEMCHIEADKRHATTTNRHLVSSENDSILAFLHTVPLRRNDEQALRVRLFDYDMNLISDHTYPMEFALKQFQLHNATVSNAGAVYVRARVSEYGSLIKANQGDRHDYRLLELNNGKASEINKWFSKEHKPGLCHMRCTEQELIITGYYGQLSAWNIRGYLLQRYDINKNEMVVDTIVPFPNDYYYYDIKEKNRHRIDKKIEADRYEDVSYRFLKSFGVDDEFFILVAEEAIKDIRRSARSNSFLTNTMALASLDRNGTLQWHNKVDKNNGGIWQSVGIASYLPLRKENYLYCLYNTNKFTLKTDYVPQSLRSSPNAATVAIAKIDIFTGKTDIELLLKQPYLQGRRLFTNSGFVMDNKAMMLCLQAEKPEYKSQLIRVFDTANEDTNVNPK